mmetsp:Transcript_11470/g.24473  ORF Transcript_11470/g.24473 Transcript_11470/m.24473 type:complete len:215 (+) Transcript_11470:206-850(+)
MVDIVSRRSRRITGNSLIGSYSSIMGNFMNVLNAGVYASFYSSSPYTPCENHRPLCSLLRRDHQGALKENWHGRFGPQWRSRWLLLLLLSATTLLLTMSLLERHAIPPTIKRRTILPHGAARVRRLLLTHWLDPVTLRLHITSQHGKANESIALLQFRSPARPPLLERNRILHRNEELIHRHETLGGQYIRPIGLHAPPSIHGLRHALGNNALL